VARTSSPAPSTRLRSGATGPSSRSTVPIPQGLLESELFATRRVHSRARIGANQASSSTRIMGRSTSTRSVSCPWLQAKPLHVLQDFRFSRVGGHGMIAIDRRVIAATNRDLERAMTHGEFREDLYYRLNVVEIRVPPLRSAAKRSAAGVVVPAKFNAQYGRQKQLLPETLARLRNTRGRATCESWRTRFAACVLRTGSRRSRRWSITVGPGWMRWRGDCHRELAGDRAPWRHRGERKASARYSSACNGIAPRPLGFSRLATRRCSTRSANVGSRPFAPSTLNRRFPRLRCVMPLVPASVVPPNGSGWR